MCVGRCCGDTADVDKKNTAARVGHDPRDVCLPSFPIEVSAIRPGESFTPYRRVLLQRAVDSEQKVFDWSEKELEGTLSDGCVPTWRAGKPLTHRTGTGLLGRFLRPCVRRYEALLTRLSAHPTASGGGAYLVWPGMSAVSLATRLPWAKLSGQARLALWARLSLSVSSGPGASDRERPRDTACTSGTRMFRPVERRLNATACFFSFWSFV